MSPGDIFAATANAVKSDRGTAAELSATAARSDRRQRSSADLEALLRKGLFLRRMFARPRGSMVDESGNPTSLALSVRRWGEAVPKTTADARRLAEKGVEILEQYHAAKAKQQLRTAA